MTRYIGYLRKNADGQIEGELRGLDTWPILLVAIPDKVNGGYILEGLLGVKPAHLPDIPGVDTAL